MSHKTHNICERGHGRTYTYVFMLRLCRLTISLRRVSERELNKCKIKDEKERERLKKMTERKIFKKGQREKKKERERERYVYAFWMIY